jgi:GT2 family glycosyltransferase
VTTGFQVFLPKPLFASDYLEFDLAIGLRNRVNLFQSTSSGIEFHRGNRHLIITRVFRKLIFLASSMFPHGSDKRKKLGELNSKLPRVVRNRIISLLAPPPGSFLKSTEAIAYSVDLGFALPTSTDPLITVVIPVYNNWWVTYRCLRTLQMNSDKTPYEVVVVDDASTDLTRDAIDNVRGITVVRNLTNIGYLLSTNRGASMASPGSKYLVLLNNDTEPLDGWLDNLFKTIENDNSVAIVGSALISPDGTVQEVGTQIFENGKAWNLGRGMNLTSQIFNFTREVDYCSAAAIMVRKTFWLDANGFDERYVPAYCEDSDLAMTAWKKNMKVVVAPKSWVLHHEGLSHGKDVSGGIKKHQVTNTRKFFAKWEVELRQHWQDSGLHRFEATRLSKGIVVVCDRQLPSALRDSGSIRTIQIIKHIQALGYHVVLKAIDNGTTQVDIDFMQSLGAEVHLRDIDFYETLKMRQSRIKAIWTIRHEVFEYFNELLSKIAPNALFVADLMDLKYNTEYDSGSGIDGDQLKIAKKVEKIILVSEIEAQTLVKESKKENASVIWTEFEPRQDNIEWGNSNGLIFVGGFRHLPNLEGIEWFADHVVPELKKIGFIAPIRVVGSGLTSQQKDALQSKGLQILGSQLDLASIYSQSRIAIVPLLTGAGRKGKIGEALSYGIPIVSTSVGVQGFSNLQTTGISVVDSPVEMATAIYEMHEQNDSWNKAAKLGKDYCRSNLSSMAMRAAISKLLTVEAPQVE